MIQALGYISQLKLKMRRIEEKKLSMHVEAFVVMLISLEKTLSILDGNCMDPWTANCSFYYECYYRLIKTKNTEHQHTIEALWYTYMSYLWHLQRFMCKCLLANAIDRLFPSLWKLHLFISRIGGKDHTQYWWWTGSIWGSRCFRLSVFTILILIV